MIIGKYTREILISRLQTRRRKKKKKMKMEMTNELKEKLFTWFARGNRDIWKFSKEQEKKTGIPAIDIEAAVMDEWTRRRRRKK